MSQKTRKFTATFTAELQYSFHYESGLLTIKNTDFSNPGALELDLKRLVREDASKVEVLELMADEQERLIASELDNQDLRLAKKGTFH